MDSACVDGPRRGARRACPRSDCRRIARSAVTDYLARRSRSWPAQRQPRPWSPRRSWRATYRHALAQPSESPRPRPARTHAPVLASASSQLPTKSPEQGWQHDYHQADQDRAAPAVAPAPAAPRRSPKPDEPSARRSRPRRALVPCSRGGTAGSSRGTPMARPCDPQVVGHPAQQRSSSRRGLGRPPPRPRPCGLIADEHVALELVQVIARDGLAGEDLEAARRSRTVSTPPRTATKRSRFPRRPGTRHRE